MAQNSVDPQFPNMRFLVSKFRADGMAEEMERHILGDANTLFMLRESPRKIVSAFARRRGNLTEGLYIGLDYEKVCFAQKKFP